MVFPPSFDLSVGKKGKAPAQIPGLSYDKALGPEIGHTYGAMSRQQQLDSWFLGHWMCALRKVL
jgi:hypothetical protein